MVQINWTTQASNDLKDIFEYISRDSEAYAKRQVLKNLKSYISFKIADLCRT